MSDIGTIRFAFLALILMIMATSCAKPIQVSNKADNSQMDSPQDVFELKAYRFIDTTFSGKKTIRLKAILINKLTKSVALHFPPMDYTMVTLVDTKGTQFPIADHRDAEDRDDDDEVMEPTIIPGGGQYALLNILFKPRDQNLYSLHWGPCHIQNIPTAAYTAKIIWKVPAVSVEGVGVMPWAPGNEAWLEDKALTSNTVRIVLDKHSQ